MWKLSLSTLRSMCSSSPSIAFVLILTGGLTCWTTSSSFSSSSTTTWRLAFRDFDFVEPYCVCAASVLVPYFCGVGALLPPHILYGRPSGAASSSPSVPGATLGDVFYFDVGGDTCLLAWRVLASLARLVHGRCSAPVLQLLIWGCPTCCSLLRV